MSRGGSGGGLRVFFEPGAIVPFLFGSLALAMAGSGAYDLAHQALDPGAQHPLFTPAAILVGALLILAVAAGFLWAWAKKTRRAVAITGAEPPAKRRAIIILVSNAEVPLAAARWHLPHLRHCWLVYSSESKPAAETVFQKLSGETLELHLKPVADAFDALEVSRCVRAIHASLPGLNLTAEDVILDFTGLTTPASVGAVIGALRVGLALQYTRADYDKSLKVHKPLDPVEVRYDWHALAQVDPEPEPPESQPPQESAGGGGVA